MFQLITPHKSARPMVSITALILLAVMSVSAAPAATLYYGGDILTMAGDTPQYAEAVVTADGKIIFAGKLAEAESKFPTENRIDLKGTTMMPSFLDPHGHFAFAVQMIDQANLAIPPVGKVTAIADVIDILEQFKQERGLSDTDWIIGWGYDQDGLKEKRHITRLDLDKDFPTNPVLLLHVSSHGAVLNSKAFEFFKINADTATPDGGVIARLPDSSEPAGLLMETAWIPVFDQLVKTALDNKLPLQVHVNADAAIDMLIEAVKNSGIAAGDDRRVLAVHSNLQAMDQLDDYVQLGITPSYFSNHAFFWGDVHVANFGNQRAFNLSPMKTAKAKGLVVSNHTDFNVTPLDPFFTIWTAVQRESRSGVVIGPAERVDTYTALQALTTGPAWQFFEEKRSGKIKPGMLADLVILDTNPLKRDDPDQIKDIMVLQTIKEGKTIYSR